MTFIALAALGIALLGAVAVVEPQDPPAPALEEILRAPILPPETAHAELRAFLEKRIPPLPQPASAPEWQAQAERLRRRTLDEVVFRGVPAAWRNRRTAVEWGETVRRPGGYSIRKLRYQAVPGIWVPALVYEPDELKGRVPAVLNVNGHVGAPGKAVDYEQVRCINLAKRGMLALHPERFNCGELLDPEFNHNRLAYLDLCGCSGVAVFHLAIQRALDILAAHPHADPGRLAMTGLSGGGWQTIWLSALDRRIAATAPDAGYIGLHARLYNRG